MSSRKSWCNRDVYLVNAHGKIWQQLLLFMTTIAHLPLPQPPPPEGFLKLAQAAGWITWYRDGHKAGRHLFDMLQVRVLCSTRLCILGAEEKGRAIREAMANGEQSILQKKKKDKKNWLFLTFLTNYIHSYCRFRCHTGFEHGSHIGGFFSGSSRGAGLCSKI